MGPSVESSGTNQATCYSEHDKRDIEHHEANGDPDEASATDSNNSRGSMPIGVANRIEFGSTKVQASETTTLFKVGTKMR